MKLLLLLSFFVAGTVAMSHMDFMWQDWKAKHGKTYGHPKHEAIRRYVWEKNLAFVDQHNDEYRQGLHTFTVAMNKYADLEATEFARQFLGLAKTPAANTLGCKNSTMFSEGIFFTVPGEMDWRQQGYVTPVKNQGQCGSCWAFSTTGSLEGQHFKASGELVSLSEQNLMDCSRPEGDFSCEGGLMDNAFDYIMKNGGIDTEASYPYDATDENVCKFTKKDVGATMTACIDVTPRKDEDALLKAAGTIGPVSVAIDAAHQSFQLYEKGVYYEPQCSQTMLDHGVLVVGYGTQGGEDYWTVKNSWGADWGMDGYLMMSRNKENNCGIATSASYPVV